MFQALSDPHRRSIVERLRTRACSAGELAAGLPVARPGVSRHLRVLREAGLVEARSHGQQRIYALRPAPLAEVDAWLEPYRQLWVHRLGALHTEVARGRRQKKEQP